MKKIIYLLFGFLVVSICINAYLYINLVRADAIVRGLKNNITDYNEALNQNNKRINSLQEQQHIQLKNAVDQLRTQASSPAASVQNDTSLFLSATVSDISSIKKTVTFWVKGPKDISFDAMDLVLTYTNTKNAPICTTGKTFALYPLVKTESSSLSIAGVAQITGNTIVTGNGSESFATCTFEKNDPSQKMTIQLDAEKTHIYSLGKSVLNSDASNIYLSW